MPHSAAGDCGTVNQYLTPFYDGVFCNLPLEGFMTLIAQDAANARELRSRCSPSSTMSPTSTQTLSVA